MYQYMFYKAYWENINHKGTSMFFLWSIISILFEYVEIFIISSIKYAMLTHVPALLTYYIKQPNTLKNKLEGKTTGHRTQV